MDAETREPPPGPGDGLLDRCRRFRRDGERCTNRGRFADGWCHQPGCPGFTRSRPTAPDGHEDRTPRGTTSHVASTMAVPLGVEVDEVDDVRVSLTARDSFRFHHGGSDVEAEVQLRMMLEDFILKSARDVHRSGYVRLSREGYELVVDPSMTVITNYSTAHKERTWEQVKAGVRSRFGHKSRASTGPAPERGPDLPAKVVLATLNPGTAFLNARTVNAFSKLHGLRDVDDASLEVDIRAALAVAKADGELGTRDRVAVVAILQGGFTWLISRDARVVVGVRRSRTSD